MSKKPLIITIEGTDGSGKETQCNKLCKYLNNNGINAKVISFPQYDNHVSSYFVKEYLSGTFGNINNNLLNVYSASIMYAMDRYISYITDWKNYDVDVLIMDRYVDSNLIHQGAKISNLSDLVRFIDWEKDLEYNRLGLPIPDITFFLNMPPEASELLRKNRKNKITGGDAQDIHEDNIEYQNKSYQTAFTICNLCDWERIDCSKVPYVTTTSDIYTPVTISKKICKKVMDILGKGGK